MTAVLGMSTREALEHCREITRRRARNFYYGLKLLPEPQRSAMFAIYAWMRRADDLVDACDSDRGGLVERIDEFRDTTDDALAGNPSEDDPLWLALAFAAETYRLEAAPFHDMLAGQLDDVDDREYRTFDDLQRYCYRVASTVGLICIQVWGYVDERAPELAIERGIAFQLTNILRDLKQDYDAGRVYLPREELEQNELTPSDLRQWTKARACEELIMAQVRRAEAFYERSAPLDSMINPQCLPTLWAMTTIYRGLLEKIGQQPSRLIFERRVRLSAWQKGMIALKAKWFITGNGNDTP